MGRKSLRVVTLTVVEVNEMLASLEEAQCLKHLTGCQRQQLEDATGALRRARSLATGGKVPVPVESMLAVLRCVSVTQQWLQLMLAEWVAERDGD